MAVCNPFRARIVFPMLDCLPLRDFKQDELLNGRKVAHVYLVSQLTKPRSETAIRQPKIVGHDGVGPKAENEADLVALVPA